MLCKTILGNGEKKTKKKTLKGKEVCINQKQTQHQPKTNSAMEGVLGQFNHSTAVEEEKNALHTIQTKQRSEKLHENSWQIKLH